LLKMPSSNEFVAKPPTMHFFRKPYRSLYSKNKKKKLFKSDLKEVYKLFFFFDNKAYKH
jgi:hypothetical protein